MGYLLSVKCTRCNYEGDIFCYGFGMRYAHDHFEMPALNSRTKKIESRNLYDKKTKEHISFYNDPSMSRPTKENYLIDCNRIAINSSGNLCPKCREYALEFNIEGNCD